MTKPFLSALVVNLDYKFNSYEEETGENDELPLPIIRIYGSTEVGQRICIHIHGVLPYAYFRPESIFHPSFASEEALYEYMDTFQNCLEEMLKAKRNSRLSTSSKRKATTSRNHIKKFEVVRKKTIYGMYLDELLFIKVTLYDPNDIVNLAAVLEENALAGVAMQPYETHIPYLLKFTSDYNVQPMGWLHLSGGMFRPPLPVSTEVGLSEIRAKTGNEKVEKADKEENERSQSFFTPTPHTQSGQQGKESINPVSVMHLDLLSSPLGSHLSPSTRSGSLQGPISGLVSQRLTSENIPAEMVWSCPKELGKQEISSTTAKMSDPLLSSQEQREVAALLESVTEADFVFSQFPSVNVQKPPSEQFHSNDNDISTSCNESFSKKEIEKDSSVEKESTCELELDVQIDQIMNRLEQRQSFGSELWTEERLRCQQKNLPFDEASTPPSTQTVHREKEPVELEFQRRFESLRQKGLALKRAAGQGSQGNDGFSSGVFTQPDEGFLQDSVLSQYAASLPVPLEGNQGDEEDPPVLTAEARSWAEEKLWEAQREMEREQLMKPNRISFSQVLSQSQFKKGFLVEKDSSPYVASSPLVLSQGHLGSQQLLNATDIPELYLFLDDSPSFPPADLNTAHSTHPADPPFPEDSRAPQYESLNDRQNPDGEDRAEEEFQQELEDILSSTQPQLPEEPEPDPGEASRLDSGPAEEKEGTGFFVRAAPALSTAPRLEYATSVEGEVEGKGSVERLIWSSSVERSSTGGTSLNASLNASFSVGRVSGSGGRKSLASAFRRKEERGVKSGKKRVSFQPSIPPTVVASVGQESTAERSGRVEETQLHVEMIGHDIDSRNSYSGSGDVVAGKRGREIGLFSSVEEPRRRKKLNNSKELLGTPLGTPSEGFKPVGRSFSSVFSSFNTTQQSAFSLSGDNSPEGGNNSDVLKALVPSSEQGLKTLWLAPSFDPPSAGQLRPLSGETKNTPLCWSDPNDVWAPLLKNSNLTVHTGSRRESLAVFDGGFPTTAVNRNSVASRNSEITRIGLTDSKLCLLPTFLPPKTSSVTGELESTRDKKTNKKPRPREKRDISPDKKSQILSPTQTQHSFCSEDSSKGTGLMKVGDAALSMERVSRLTLMSIEIFCCTRGSLLPNPKHDVVNLISWSADDTTSSVDAQSENTDRLSGCIALLSHQSFSEKGNKKAFLGTCGLPRDSFLQAVGSEKELFEAFVSTVQSLNPDFLVGYEVQSSSLGFLIRRGRRIGIDLLRALSKMPKERPSFKNGLYHVAQSGEAATADHEDRPVEEILVRGRAVLNNWQLMSAELKLFSYTSSNVAQHVLSRRVPHYSHEQMTIWFRHPTTAARTIRHLHRLALLNLQLLEALDLIRRTAECARLYGIDFYSVVTRGSQYRVEAALLTKAHALNYLLLSPTRRQVASQAPMEVIPLVLEPKSAFYADPVVVLDFQSLYPSMILAFNLCFSTIFGKLRPSAGGGHHGTNSGTSGGRAGDGEDPLFSSSTYKGPVMSLGVDTTEVLGVTSYPETSTAVVAALYPPRGAGKEVFDDSTPYLAPNGSLFCSRGVRKGVLPEMVREMLATRVMVKSAKKRHCAGPKKAPSAFVLEKVLEARQLAIKLLSNVTYGYTAAGFSGRMPMAELADAIVQSGRSLLEWTMRQIRGHPLWKADVSYGDTDSIFVRLKNRSVAEAFRIGREIAAHITALTPTDVVLKFEKVYFPCILVTKKRYVGFAFETESQTIPHFDAKGIECVRRDQCPATVKLQEKALRVLFTTRDLSQVKHFLSGEWLKMLQGGDKLLLRDFIFRKEVKFGKYASVSSQPPGAIVATKAVLRDEMAVPPLNWRVPYAVVHGPPKSPLKDLVVDPYEILTRGSNLRVNYVYYINKCINPALDRVLSLCCVDPDQGAVFPNTGLLINMVTQWFRGLTRPKIRMRHINYDLFETPATKGQPPVGPVVGPRERRGRQTSMDQFTTQGSCEICENDAMPRRFLCKNCLNEENKKTSLCTLMNRLKFLQQKDINLKTLCQNCSRFPQPSQLYRKGQMIGDECCGSLDCPVFHERNRLVTRLEDCLLSVRDVEANEHRF